MSRVTTAAVLGAYHRELLAQELNSRLVGQVIRDAAAYAVKTEGLVLTTKSVKKAEKADIIDFGRSAA